MASMAGSTAPSTETSPGGSSLGQGNNSRADPLMTHLKPATSFLRNAWHMLLNLSVTPDYRRAVEAELQLAEQQIAAIRQRLNEGN